MVTSDYEKLTQHLSAVGSDIRALKFALDEHIKNETIWRETAEPVLLMGRNMQGFGRIAKVIAYTLVTGATIIGSIYVGIQWLRK